MRWEITGTDRRTGKDRTFTVEAKDEPEARALGQYNDVLVSSIRSFERPKEPVPVIDYATPTESDIGDGISELGKAVGAAKDVAIHLARATPGLAADLPIRITKSRPAKFAKGIFGLVGFSVSVWLLVMALNSGKPAPPAYVPSPSYTAPIATGHHLSYSEFARSMGDRFEVEQRDMMDGSTKYLGKDTSWDAVLVVIAKDNEVSYAHLAIILTPSLFNSFMYDSRIGGSTSEQEKSIGQTLTIGDFTAATMPEWKNANLAVMSGIAKAFREGRTRSSVANGDFRINLELESATRMVKIIIDSI